jgi:hypothetical protein
MIEYKINDNQLLGGTCAASCSRSTASRACVACRSTCSCRRDRSEPTHTQAQKAQRQSTWLNKTTGRERQQAQGDQAQKAQNAHRGRDHDRETDTTFIMVVYFHHWTYLAPAPVWRTAVGVFRALASGHPWPHARAGGTGRSHHPDTRRGGQGQGRGVCESRISIRYYIYIL